MLVTKQLLEAIDLHNMENSTMEIIGYCQLFGYQHKWMWINKLIQVWNNMKVSKWWQNFPFCVNHPFSKSKHEIKTRLLKQPCHFILLLQVFELFEYCECCFTGLERFALQVPCCTRCATEQVYYIRKAINMELVMWRKCHMRRKCHMGAAVA